MTKPQTARTTADYTVVKYREEKYIVRDIVAGDYLRHGGLIETWRTEYAANLHIACITPR